MTKFPALGRVWPDLELAEMIYQTKVAHTFDEGAIAVATAAFNAVLARAAEAILEDLGHPQDSAALLALWRPVEPEDTWFGPEPGHILRHILETGVVHRGGAPDETALH